MGAVRQNVVGSCSLHVVTTIARAGIQAGIFRGHFGLSAAGGVSSFSILRLHSWAVFFEAASDGFLRWI